MTKYDWEAIFTDIRAGVLSKREIARQYSVDPSYMLRKAKQAGVKPDLSARVQQAVHTKLVHKAVYTPNACDDEIIDAESDKVVGVVELHRKDIRGAKSIVATLTQQISEIVKAREETEDEIIDATKAEGAAETATARKARRSKRARMLKAVSIPAHVACMRDLSVALKNLIPLERQAFSLDGGDNALRELIDVLSPAAKKLIAEKIGGLK